MKTLRISMTLAVALGLLTVGAAFGATASSNAGAEVIQAIGITNNVGMNFGKVAASGTAGTVILLPARTRSATGGVTLGNGTSTAASFDVTGAGTSTYAITLPSSAVTLSDGASDTMTVDLFTSTPSATGTLTAGAQTLTVGATLNVGVGQVIGTYTGTFDVSVDYN